MAQASNMLRATRHTMSQRSNARDIGHQDFEIPSKNEAVPPAVPAPPYRHAAPSGPWPWMDFKCIDDPTPPSTVKIDPSWPGYPQNLFGNWTPPQVERSQMLIKCSKNQSSTIYMMDVLNTGKFVPSSMGSSDPNDPSRVGPGNENVFWEKLQQERPEGIRVRSLCVDDLTKPTLQMLGTRYNIEPFFFTSSVNWIPSRYQEAPTYGEGDHITVTLPFVRMLHASPSTSSTPTRKGSQQSPHSSPEPPQDKHIDTQAPFHLQDGNMLLIDLLAIHMVRGVKTSTVISYHPESSWCQTSAKRLHKLMMLVGGSVYWQHIFTKTEDPTFLFLTILWYALYAWDESFEFLYKHVSTLESDVLKDRHIYPPDRLSVAQEQEKEKEKESPLNVTRQLHVLQAHLLHYRSLLHHFRVSVDFIQGTPNPAMMSPLFTDDHRKISKQLMERECKNLVSEIDRLEKRREMLSSRLKNAMDLAFASVNIEDSRLTRRLTEATVRDSAAMRQISYLTMVFLPASFTASVFGMNVAEINPGTIETLAHYAETTVALTLFTVYIVVTLQPYSTIHNPGASFLQRAAWPILFSKRWMQKKPERPERLAEQIV